MRIHVCHPIIVAQLAYAEVLNSLICKAIALVIHGVQVQLPLVSFNPLLTMTLSLLQLPDLLFQFIFLPPQSNQFTLHGQNPIFLPISKGVFLYLPDIPSSVYWLLLLFLSKLIVSIEVRWAGSLIDNCGLARRLGRRMIRYLCFRVWHHESLLFSCLRADIP
jgi:hypothetical protein